jgi:hypothetical protein
MKRRIESKLLSFVKYFSCILNYYKRNLNSYDSNIEIIHNFLLIIY